MEREIMRKPKIYLETTMFNYYFDKERDAHPDTVKLFEEIKAGKYKAYSSVYAVDELMKAPEIKRKLMLELFDKYDIEVFEPSQEAEKLADMYVSEGIIPKTHIVDSRHIAIATVNDLEMILSLNFTHIVRKTTIELTELVNVREGYRKVQIYAPMEVVEK
jgi:predicted nucleic acid-binding protein